MIESTVFLHQAGYGMENWQSLEDDLKSQILPLDAIPKERNKYGQMYEMRGTLTGPNNKTIQVCTIWMSERETKITKFITMLPDKTENDETRNV